MPIRLAEGCKLKRDIPGDTAITYDDVEIPSGRFADKLRAEQDARWPG